MFDRRHGSRGFVPSYVIFWPFDGAVGQKSSSYVSDCEAFVHCFVGVRSVHCVVGVRSESERPLVHVIPLISG